jgi:DNA-binding transcriptional regulator YiaG/uncharacterized phage-associated protein
MPSKKKPEVKLETAKKSFVFRGEEFEIVYHFYEDEETNETFTTTDLDELNLTQVHNKYRSKYGIPFPEEIISIREQYGLTAAKMSEILGFGPNSFKNYENGEIPSIPHGRYIQLIKDRREFIRLIELNKNEFDADVIAKINKKVEAALHEKSEWDLMEELYLFEHSIPDEYNGYRKPSINKIGNMVSYIAKKLSPVKTKMNKLLFYSDFLHYKKTGFSISGLKYIAITHGPVPKNYGAIYNSLLKKGFIDISIEVYADGIEGEKIIGENDANLEDFNRVEIDVIDDVINSLGDNRTKILVKKSHEEFAWLKNYENKGRISFEESFHLKHI